MTWRIHLTNQAIRALYILPGKPPTLVAWTSKRRANFYDLDTGTLLKEHKFSKPPTDKRQSEAWHTYLGTLKASDSSPYLPHVRMKNLELFGTDDGKLRLYRERDDNLFIEIDGDESELKLVDAEQLISLDLDRALGTIVGLDEACQLHVYQQDMRVGAFDIGLENSPDLRPGVVVSRGGGNIYATDGRRLVAADAGGKVLKRLDLHYYVGRMTCSPGGGMVITTDMESGVMRVYRGETLTLTHQKFAIDLVADATQLQLLADLPPTGTAISALTAYNRGVIGFAMSGVICVTDVEAMDEVPRPKALL